MSSLVGLMRLSAGELPAPLRWPAYGAAAAGVVGTLTGVVIGLLTYAPTAWAASVEVGAPASALGALLGGAVGLAENRAARRSRRS